MIARAAPHYWEEPCISGKHADGEYKGRGSGAIFFSNCPLRCVFCQNREISFGGAGKQITSEKLGEIMLRLRDGGAYNINLVSPTQYADVIARALEKVKPSLGIPVVWNTGGYELTSTLRTLDGLVDIWLPDLYMSHEISKRYDGAEDYFEYASEAVKYMVKSAGKPKFDAEGMMKSGVIVRHMVIPTHRADSAAIIRWIAENLGAENVMISLMSQYMPTEWVKSGDFPELERKITTFEYESVADEARKLGLNGYGQQKTSAKKAFVPDFDFTGID